MVGKAVQDVLETARAAEVGGGLGPYGGMGCGEGGNKLWRGALS